MTNERNEVAEVVATGAATVVAVIIVAAWLMPGIFSATLGGGLTGAGTWLLKRSFGK
jgi:hypothetical protein